MCEKSIIDFRCFVCGNIFSIVSCVMVYFVFNNVLLFWVSVVGL